MSEQAEMKNEAVEHLRILLGSSVSEEDAKVIFDRYDSSGSGTTWTPRDVRLFLFDLQESFGFPRVIPDETLRDIITELQLNLEASGGVTWVEFKSYCMYLQSAPLKQLHETVGNSFSPSMLQRAVLVRRLPPTADRERLLLLLRQACGGVQGIDHVFVANVTDPAGNVTACEALVCFGPSALADAVDRAVATSGSALPPSVDRPAADRGDGQGVEIRAWDSSLCFPSLAFNRKPSHLARAIGQVFIKARELDERFGITRRAQRTAEEFKLRDKLEAAREHSSRAFEVARQRSTEAVRSVDSKLHISERASRFDEQYHVSQRVQEGAARARETLSQVSDRVMANEHVRNASLFLERVASNVSQSLTELREDTRVAIAEYGSPSSSGDQHEQQDEQKQLEDPEQQRGPQPRAEEGEAQPSELP